MSLLAAMPSMWRMFPLPSSASLFSSASSWWCATRAAPWSASTPRRARHRAYMRKRSSFDFSSYLSREIPVRRSPCGLRIWRRYVKSSTPNRLHAHRTQPSSSAASLRFGWHRWSAHQRNRCASGSWARSSQSRQHVTMLSTPPDRLSTMPEEPPRSPSSPRESRSLPTSPCRSRPAREEGSTRAPRMSSGLPRRQRASSTPSRGGPCAGGPLRGVGSSSARARAR
mmetsp:Transcript_83507/g.236921  ORF Transcript_83507/g.236921 Transcript_83507/m.236921 type:complete len:226 (+) Transcript_83507:1024-1701(+)